MMNKSIQKYYLFLTLFITGAAVMGVELAGTRVVAPVYGSGLFVWASLITVALTCLAIGYWIGGKIADKKPKFSTFYLIILIGGILIAPVSQISSPILKLTANLGFRIGPLFSAYILFALPLVLLGMVSPYAIKLSTTELNVLGATAGKLYAISTMGSFFGTLLTGFILIP
ncbi:MAG: fused MFS/spermidine synthase, partial [bacterium]